MRFYSFGRAVCNAVFSVYFHIKISGLEHLPDQQTGFVMISNHQSYLDPVMLGVRLKKRYITFMAKEELFHVPVLGYIIKKLGAFPVKRGSRAGKALETAKNVVKNNKLLALFPEGHRSKTGSLLRPKSGAVVIASTTKAPIVPAAIYYSGRYPRAKVYIHYGKPILNEYLKLSQNPTPKEIKKAVQQVWGKVEQIYQKEQEEQY